MKKKALEIVGSIVALTMVISALTACGGSNTTTNNKTGAAATATATPKPPVTIQYFTWGTGSKSVVDPMIDKFNKTNKDNITVEVNYKSGEWQTPLKTAILSAQAPDLMQGTPDLIESISNNWIEPWDNYVSADFKKRTDPIAFKVSVGGEFKTYSYLYSCNTYKIAYNKEIFKEAGITNPPKTWQEIYDDAKLITQKGNGKYYGIGLPIAKGNIAFAFGGIAAYEGFYDFGYDFKRNAYDFSYTVPYLKLFQKMLNEKLTFPGSEILDNDGIRAQFAAGKIGMFPSLSWDVVTINDQFKATCDWGVTNFPTAIDGKNKGAMQLRDGATWQLSSSSKHKKETATFLEFLLSDDFQSELFSKGVNIVTLPSAIEAAKSKPAAPYKQWADYAPSKDMVSTGNVVLGKQLTGDNAENTFSKIIVTPDIDIDATLRDLSKRFNDALYQQAKTDAEKVKQSGSKVDRLGKIMTVDGFDPLKPIDPAKIKYITADEWLKLQK